MGGLHHVLHNKIAASMKGITIYRDVHPDATFQYNFIRGCVTGVKVAQGSNAKLVLCEISQSLACGVFVSAGACPVVENCAVVDGRGFGVVLRKCGAQLKRCRITGNADMAVFLEGGGEVPTHVWVFIMIIRRSSQ